MKRKHKIRWEKWTPKILEKLINQAFTIGIPTIYGFKFIKSQPKRKKRS